MTASRPWQETLVEKEVTYHIEFQGRQFLIEHVPARINLETGERHLAPETVECLHQIVRGGVIPVRTIENPVYEYEAVLQQE